MKRFLTLAFTLILFLTVSSTVQANEPTEVRMTHEELETLAKQSGWDDIRQPQDSYILPIDRLANTLYENYKTRNTIFTTNEIPLRPLQEGDTSIERQVQIQQAVYEAVRLAARFDEAIAYDLRAYEFVFRFWHNRVIITFHYNYGQTYDQVRYVENEVKNIIDDIIHPSMTIHEKVKTIHDYVVRNTAYDETKNQEKNTPYHALTEGKSLCGGYAQLTYLLLKEAGIEARIISGQSQNVNHAWNLVKVDDAWYHLDTTWNDPLPDKEGRVLYTYYMLPDKAMRKTHYWKNGGLNNYDNPYPHANNSYVKVLQEEGLYQTLRTIKRPMTNVLSVNMLRSVTEQAIERYEPHITIAFPAHVITKQDVQNMIFDLGQQHHIDVHYFYVEAPLHMLNMNEVTIHFNYKGAPTLTSLEWEGLSKSSITTTVNQQLPIRLIATWENGTRKDVTSFADVTLHQSSNVAMKKDQTIYFMETGTVRLMSNYQGQVITHQVNVQNDKPFEIPQHYQPYIEEKLQTKNTKKVWALGFNEHLQKIDLDVYSLNTNEKVPIRMKRVMQRGMPTLLIEPQTSWEKGSYVVLLHDIQSDQQPAQSLKEKYYFTFQVN